MRKRIQWMILCLAAIVFTGKSSFGFDMVYAAKIPAEKPESEMTEQEKAEKAAREAREARERLIQEAYALPVQTNELKSWPQAPGTYGESAIVMDADTGAILFAKNIDKVQYPASITKVLTALLAFESEIPLETPVTVSAQALECLGRGYSAIGLKAGNVISLDQAVYAMLMASANEAAYTVGENVAREQGESYEWFLQRMNERCRELGGENSNFVNTNGVFEENHYTTARDMALIGKELFAYPHFSEICKTQQYVIPASGTVEEHVFQQHHHMLLEGNQDYYEYVIGGKTGYTTEADNTLITMADNGSRRLVCVLLKEYEGHAYTDTRALLEYGFGNFQDVSIREQDNLKGYELEDPDATVTLPEEVAFKKLERVIDEEKETVSYYYKENLVGSAKITETESLRQKISEKENGETEEKKAPESEKTFDVSILIKFGIMMLGLCVLALFMIAHILRMQNRRKKKKRKKHQRK